MFFMDFLISCMITLTNNKQFTFLSNTDEVGNMKRVYFKVNGVEHSVGCEVSSTSTLLDYIRNKLELRGTKYMCLEGGCGVCIVSAKKYPGDAPQGVNSCMVLIMSCSGWEIVTIEGIGNRLIGYHPIQKTLAKKNGSQCGYCSSGWIMALYSLLKTKKQTRLEMEQSFGSNICRCTGYRPILDTSKAFASDAPNSYDVMDIEDFKICDKAKELCSEDKCAESDWCMVSVSDFTEILHIKLNDNRDWYRVHMVNDIFNIWQEKGTQSYRLIAGNTGKGVYPIIEYPNVLIDITGVTDLKGIYIDQNFVLGAGNTLSDVINIFEANQNTEFFSYFSKLKDHLKLVAHITIRNVATIAGNLMLKNEHPEFKSDVFLILETVGAQVTIMTAALTRKIVTMQNFLKEDMKGKIIINVLLPPMSKQNRIVTFKIMPRSQNAHAIVHAGFSYKINESNKIVIICRIVYGGLSPNFIRAWKTERYLIGKKLFTNETLQGALKVLTSELMITENLPDPPVEHRRRIALGLFYKGLLSMCPTSILNSRFKSGAIKLRETRPVSEGHQVYDTDSTIWPLNEPIQKVDALIQCSGEAKYSEDIPTLPEEVFSAFVLSTVGLGTIATIDPSKALNEPGVIAFYTASDIPGVNTFTSPPVSHFLTTIEEIVANKEIKYYNQPLGIIVAINQQIANKAAFLVQVKYTNVHKPVIDVKIALNDPHKVTLFKSSDATKMGKDVIKVIKGESTIYEQYHFCMETLVCVSYPIEEGLQLNAATHWTDNLQKSVSRMLKIEQNKIDVVVRRLGGSFGVKITRSAQVAAACAFVSYKLNRPCRFIQSLTNNMRAVGKRLPCSINFEIGVNSKGVIQYLNYNLYSDNGYIFNEPLIALGTSVYNNCYRKDTWNYKAFNVVTDKPSNSWCRSPGSLEHISMAETLMERISYELKLDPLDVRLANLDTENYSDIIEILDTLKNNSQYTERAIAVNDFNAENRWKKRGLRFSFLRWVPPGAQYMDINLSVYNDDGSVAITHGGIEMGQGINTRAIQVCAYFLNISVKKIQIKPSCTTTSPNGTPEGGSLTSQNVCLGIQKCCEELLKRLEELRNMMNNPPWEQLIKEAYAKQIDLQVHSSVNYKDAQNYDIYGVTLAEVEVDVLTGEWQMIRVDLIEDCGRSINPALDVGQIEGAFTMGVGYFTCENFVYDPETGELLTNRTWDYWVPQALDIPQDFRIYLRKKSFSTEVILGSKAVGEPPTCMGIVVAFALRHAITAARLESDIPSTEWFQIDGPFTVDKICFSCASKIEDFKFY